MSTNDPNQFNPQGNPQGAPHDEWFVEFSKPQEDQGVPGYQPGQFVNAPQAQNPQIYDMGQFVNAQQIPAQQNPQIPGAQSYPQISAQPQPQVLPQVQPQPQPMYQQPVQPAQPQPQYAQPVQRAPQPQPAQFVQPAPQPAPQPVQPQPAPQPQPQPQLQRAPQPAPPYQPSDEVDPLDAYRNFDPEEFRAEDDEPKKKGGKNTFPIVIASIMAFLVVAAVVFFVFVMPKLKDDDSSSKSGKGLTRPSKTTEETDETEDTEEPEDPDDTKATSDSTKPSDVDSPTNVTLSSQITSAQMDQMKDLVSQDFTETIAENRNIVFENFNYLGTIIIVSKDLSDISVPESIVYLVYQFRYYDKNEAGRPVKEYYWYEGFGGVYLDGTIDTSSRFPITTQYTGNGWSTAGTTDITAARNEIKSSSKFVVMEDNIDTTLINPVPTANKEGFIFPNSDTQKIDDADIAKLSDEDLRKAINEIWARHGYIFRKKEILDYYRQFDWYKETVSADEWDKNGQDHYLNAVEKDNMARLVKEREKRGGNGA